MKRAHSRESVSFHYALMAIEALEMAVFLLSVFSFGAVLLHMEQPIPLLFAALFLPAAGCRFLMEKADKLWQYLLFWLLMLVGFGFGFSAVGGFICSAASVVTCLILFIQRLFPSLRDTVQPGWVRLGAMAVLFCIASSVSSFSASVFLYCAMLYMMLKFLWDALDETDTYIQDMEGVSFLPEKQIRTMGGGISILYAVLTGCIMLIFSFLPLQGTFEWLGRAILAALRWFFSLFSGGDQSAPLQEETISPDNSEMLPEGGSTGWLAAFLQQVLFILGIGILCVGFVAAIAYIIYKLYKNFYDVPKGHIEEREFILPFLKTEKLTRQKDGARKRWGRDPASKIRRIYRKKIKGAMPKRAVPSPGSTPTEQMEAANLWEKPESEGFHSLYEKARYGKGVTGEEAERMRSFSSKL